MHFKKKEDLLSSLLMRGDGPKPDRVKILRHSVFEGFTADNGALYKVERIVWSLIVGRTLLK